MSHFRFEAWPMGYILYKKLEVEFSSIVESNPGSKSEQIPQKGFSSGFYPNRCHETPKKSPKSLEVDKVEKITIFYIA